jgi:hypothetical protein
VIKNQNSQHLQVHFSFHSVSFSRRPGRFFPWSRTLYTPTLRARIPPTPQCRVFPRCCFSRPGSKWSGEDMLAYEFHRGRQGQGRSKARKKNLHRARNRSIVNRQNGVSHAHAASRRRPCGCGTFQYNADTSVIGRSGQHARKYKLPAGIHTESSNMGKLLA